MSALPTVDAQSHGHPAKAIRLPDELVSAPATETIRVAVEETPPPPAETITVAEPEPVLVVEAERPRRPSQKIVLTNGPYLPVTGASPLRFAATRSWPAPIPPPEAGEKPEVVTVAAEVPPAPAAKPIAPAEPAATEPVKPQPAPTSAIAHDATMPNILTADMVLGYLGDLPSGDKRVQARFEPALPQGTVPASGPISP